ncbi:hypothetical protein [Halostreptopolyspora alba]|uniref:hypothetical protein n=1 Tax=Halostreptopolyspora alba TaxID=2487137 RepID=UPI0037144A92
MDREHTTTAGDPGSHLITSSVVLEEARASLEEEDPGSVEEVLPSIGGAIVVLDDGVAAVDPDTGKQRWSYRLPGTEVAAGITPLDTTDPDEDTTQRVVLTYNTPSLLGGTRGHTVSLSVYTGQKAHSSTHPVRDAPNERVRLLTKETWVIPRDNRTLEAFSLEHGQPSWEYQAPQGCRIDMPTTKNTVSGVATMQSQVIAAWHCPGEQRAQAVSLDSVTGEQEWVDTNVAWDREGTPQVRTMDTTDLATTEPPHAAHAIVQGDLDHYYRLLDEDGKFVSRGIWSEIEGLDEYVPAPATGPPDPTDQADVVVGHSDELRYALSLYVINEFLDRGMLDPDDIYEDTWVEGPDGERQLMKNRQGRMIGTNLIHQALEDDDQD